MIKKILAIIIAIIMVNTMAYAITLEEAVDIVAKRLFVETSVDRDVLRLYKDWGYVNRQYIETMAGALHAGVLCPTNNMLKPKSEDLTPLFNGMFRFGMMNQTFDVVGFQGDYDIQTNNETVYIIDNQMFTGNTTGYELDKLKYYYAVVNRDNRAYIIWQPTINVKANWLYKGELFLVEGDNYIITSAKKLNFNTWTDISDLKYTNVKLGKEVEVTKNKYKIEFEDININHLDTEVYIVGDYYGGEITATYFEIK